MKGMKSASMPCATGISPLRCRAFVLLCGPAMHDVIILKTAVDRSSPLQTLHEYKIECLQCCSPGGGVRYTPEGTPARAPAFVAPPCGPRPAAPLLRGSHP